MAKPDKPMNPQQQAINDYLQALLSDVPEEPSEPVSLAEPQPRTLGLDQLVEAIPDTPEQTETEVALQQQVESKVSEDQQTALQQASTDRPQPAASGVPDWAEHAFQCLLFRVSGLTLAVPLVKLNSVIPWSDKIVSTPNKTDWYLGLVNHQGRNVKVIDTALMVLPENRRHLLVDEAQQRSSHILLVDDYTWGLACDEIGDVVWLSADDVKWRKNKTMRPWLAGTAIEQMCALMDTEVFADMLNLRVSDEASG